VQGNRGTTLTIFAAHSPAVEVVQDDEQSEHLKLDAEVKEVRQSEDKDRSRRVEHTAKGRRE